MNKKRMLLAERREHLIMQAAAQRMALARGIEPWRVPLARVDQGLAALRYIKSHPAWIVGSAALLAVLRISRVWRQLGSARAMWQRMHKQRDR